MLKQNSVFKTMMALLLLLGFTASVGFADTPNYPIKDFFDVQFLTSRDPNVVRFNNPLWSPDSRFIALSDENHNGVYLYDTFNNVCLQITDAPSSGYAHNWSYDSKKIGFKLLISKNSDGFPLQMPVVFHVDTQELVSLHSVVQRAGVPSFSRSELVAFTIEQNLKIADESGNILKTFPLDNYANLAPVSPDGTKVAYNSRDDQIWVIEIETGRQGQLTSNGLAYYNPVWSPDSTKLLISTISGQLKAVDVLTGHIYKLDSGVSPSWYPDSKTIFYSQIKAIEGSKVISADIYHIQYDGSGKMLLTNDTREYETSARISPDGKNIAYVSLKSGAVYLAPLIKNAVRQTETGESPQFSLGSTVKISSESVNLQKWNGVLPFTRQEIQSMPRQVEPSSQIQINNVPYIHQVYDTPDAFNGHWACNASSALMGITYYGILDYWDITCSWPSPHTSHYGQYVSEIYTYNGYTYDIGSLDASDNLAYGGYGYIVRDDWADTKSYMRDFIDNHGLSSDVDWSPTWDELGAEINNFNPFVLLNNLTSAGHYVLAIGYYDNQHTAIFNDPYGNKNTQGYPSYDGADSKYDWPGYNNGYQNLNTVHCFIYCRGTLQPDLTISSSDISFNPSGPVDPGTTVNITGTIHNDGGIGATCDVSIWYDDQAAGLCVTIEDFIGISVEADGTTNVQTTWDSTGLSTTTYPVYVTIRNSDPDESNTDNNVAHSDFGVPVELSAFSAQKQTDGSVLLQWQTASETLNQGWNILRRIADANSAWKKVNNSFIKGAGTAPFGKEYEFVDYSAEQSIQYVYALKWISTEGKAESSNELRVGQQFGGFRNSLMEEFLVESDSQPGLSLTLKTLTNWLTDEHGADYLIIVPDALKDGVELLAGFRRDQGYRVELVSIEEIYTLFPEDIGEKAILRFIRFVYNNWQPPKVHYVLLVGDAVVSETGEQDISSPLLPTFVKNISGVGLIPTDYPYTCLTGNDIIPELTVGRLPARSLIQLDSMVKKITRYETSAVSTEVVFANGDYVKPGDEYAETSSEAIIADYCEGLFDVIRIYTTPLAESLQQYQGTADDLATMLNKGCSWIELKGHGSASTWAGLLDVWGVRDIRATGQLPIINSVSCFTAFFADPENRVCMAEALLRNPVGGAVAYIGNTGHGMLFTGHDFSSAVWGLLTSTEAPQTVGNAVSDAKKMLAEQGGDAGFLHSINLFGDPALRVRLMTK